MKSAFKITRLGFVFSGLLLCALLSGAAIAAVFHVNMNGVVGSNMSGHEAVPLNRVIGSQFIITTKNDPSNPAAIPDVRPSFRNYGNIVDYDPFIRDNGMLEFYWKSDYRQPEEELTDDRSYENRASASSYLSIRLDWAALNDLATKPEGTSGLVALGVSHVWYQSNFGGYETWEDDAFWANSGSVAYATVLEAEVPIVPIPASGILGVTGVLAFAAVRARRKRILSKYTT
jgi:hypothetical protein